MASILSSTSNNAKTLESSAAQFNPSVIVGIDLGTARSGYSYALVKRPKEIVCEQPGSGNLKQLTAVLLRSDMQFVAFGDSARKQYLECDAGKQNDLLYFSNFKMVLYADDLKSRPLITAANGKTVSSVDVIAAALKYFKDQSLLKLRETSDGLIKSEDVQFVVTLPAIW